MFFSGCRGGTTVFVCLAVLLCPGDPTEATQQDYTGEERITGQQWSLEFSIPAPDGVATSIRLPYPNYTYKGRWATYSTGSVSVYAIGECGPITYKIHHYNEGYSNQGVWLELIYPCPTNRIYLTVQQSVMLSLPGIDCPLYFYPDDEWVNGSYYVDVGSDVVAYAFSEAMELQGCWHLGGGRHVPERVVNWMNENMTWGGSYTLHEPKPASQVLTELYGHCEEWAHAACALLLKSGIPAKVVMSGMIPSYNSTAFRFSEVGWHLGVAYWDGFGWILIDPQFSSGFAIPNRVILASDRDSNTIKLKTSPEYLVDQINNDSWYCDAGNFSGGLMWQGDRCPYNGIDILEHFEDPDLHQIPGTEPVECIIPNVLTGDFGGDIPSGSVLFCNYPNPFNPVTTFRFVVDRPGRVRIDIFSVDGSYVDTVINAYYTRGRHEIPWSVKPIPSGVYFARIVTPTAAASRKIVILK